MPLTAFSGVVIAGIVGLMLLGDVGVIEATFWLVDLTSIELHFLEEDGPETATKAYAVLVTVSLVVTGLWVGETVLSAAFGGQVQEELRHMQANRAIDDSNVNIQTTITAGQIAPTVRLVVRVGDAMYEPFARRAGADEVVIPEVVSGEKVTETL